jgi:hypothetical protein
MAPTGKLLAWINQCGAHEYIAAFVGDGATPRRDFAGRAPAEQLCTSPHEARRWIEDQAAAFPLPIEWVEGPRS